MALYVLKNNTQVATIIIYRELFIKNRYRHCELALLCVSKKALGVIPWSNHGIQKQLTILIMLVFLTGSRDQVAG
ncbi:MAG: hypothetical protein AB8U77_01340 [Rickettsia conorii subsp. raoultii]|uniref:Uncharacterized protein n=1 Tax=Rickettsia conorii subsp. raoultii TaxID=369822 RepID=A0A9N7AW14_RICCR|nr:hypothetical protein UQ52_02495 [Rickettsia conorii subsp. raoultii]APZ29921.1 hypothetical protein RRIM16_02690 [Rickettsia conorii subsp. raoultii]